MQLSTSSTSYVNIVKHFIYVIYCVTESPLTENGAFDFMRAQHNIIILMVIIDDGHGVGILVCIIIIFFIRNVCIYFVFLVIGNLFKLRLCFLEQQPSRWL